LAKSDSARDKSFKKEMKNKTLILLIVVALLAPVVSLFFVLQKVGPQRGQLGKNLGEAVETQSLQNEPANDTFESKKEVGSSVENQETDSEINEELNKLDVEMERAFREDQQEDPTSGI